MNAPSPAILPQAPEAIGRAAFRPTLLRTLDYLAGWCTAELLMAIVEDEPLLSALEEGVSAEQLAARLGSPASAVTGASASELTGALLRALHSEGVLVLEDGVYKLAEDLSELRAAHGWLELLMEGYRELFQGVGRLLREGDGAIERNHLRVATGSARIAVYDAVPLTLRLIERLGAEQGTVLDYGCGSGLYLIALCAQHPRLRAIGVELAQETVAAAREHVRAAGMGERIAIEHASAPDYAPREPIDFVVSAFVLHEIVGQRGIDATVEFLRSIGARFPDAKLLIVEVSDPYAEGRGALVGSDRQGRGYYNYYIWLHSVTTQRLLTHAQWLELFARAGYRVLHEERVEDVVDSTGLEIGYALERV
ncbi:MAG TPA: methyltransferase domain-containing protein [Solirubrobacteraceae bacterium]|nr:methyltransferase domain-containing protein [Solirubrobacteraceae bacterium]